MSDPVPDPDASDDEVISDAVTLGRITDAAAETDDPALQRILDRAADIITDRHATD